MEKRCWHRFFVSVIFTFAFAKNCHSLDASTLKFVHVIWRHGDRSPSDPTFPTDTKNGVDTWPQGWGELSEIGVRQHYALGAFLRRRYVDSKFLSNDYNSSEIYIRSTSYNRTLMSALSNMAGMFPAQKTVLNATTWQPIPVHSILREDDPLLWMDRPCPVAQKIYDEVLKSEAVRKVETEYADFIQYLRNMTGMKIPSIDDMWLIFDPLNCELRHNDSHKWPDWVTPEIFKNISFLHDVSSSFYYHDSRLQRFRGGMLFDEIASRMEEKSRNSPTIQPAGLKYYVYSAHDTTMEALLENFDAYDGRVPSYATAILIELHETKPGLFLVEVLYINETGSENLVPVIVKECAVDGTCPLNVFVSLARKHAPKDWFAECGIVSAKESDTIGHLKVAAGVLGILTALFFTLFVILLVLYVRSKRGSPFTQCVYVKYTIFPADPPMLATNIVAIFFGFWSLVYLIDFYFRQRNFLAYVRFAERTGLVVSPFQVRLYAGRFERLLLRSEILKRPTVRRFFDVWFFVGVGAAVSALFFMLWLLTTTLYGQTSPIITDFLGRVWTSSKTSVVTGSSIAATSPNSASSNVGIVPIVPGVNIPWSQAPLLFAVLALASVVHELGHAIAAVNENVNVSNFGVFMLGVYPGAFTELDSENLDALSSFRRLKIYCGGIWHNLASAFLAVLCLTFLPQMLSFGYMHGKGVVVLNVGSESGLATDGGLTTGQVIYGINHCKIFNEDDWMRCLSTINRQHFGHCVPKMEFTSNIAERVYNVQGELHCCNVNTTQTNMCFYAKSVNESTLENIFEYSCMPARYVTDHSVCNYSIPCAQRSKSKCVYAALFNSTRLMRFRVANQSKPVLFVGSPAAILPHVTVGSYVPRSRLAPAWLPHGLDLLFRYLFTFSLALGLLNAVPCYSLDGQYVAHVLSEAAFFRRRVSRGAETRRRHFLYRILMLYGTFVLIAVVFIAMATFLKPFM